MSHETEHASGTQEPGDPAAVTSTGSDAWAKDHASRDWSVSTSASEDAPAEAEVALRDAVEEAGEEAEPVQSRGMLKSGVSASEAAQLRWAKHRAREAAQNALPDLDDSTDIIVRVPIGRRAILTELEKKAKAGDTGASRELRAWLMELPIEDDTDVSTLDRRTRQSLMAELLGVVRDQDEDGISHPPS